MTDPASAGEPDARTPPGPQHSAAGTSGSDAPDHQYDDELITTWGLLTEAVTAATARMAEDLNDNAPLTLTDLDVMIRLYREPGHRLPIATIALQLGISTPGAAKIISRMELAGLVVTTSHADGHLSIFATSTDRGHQLTTLTLVSHTAALRRQLLEPLGIDGIRQLSALSRALRERNT